MPLTFSQMLGPTQTLPLHSGHASPAIPRSTQQSSPGSYKQAAGTIQAEWKTSPGFWRIGPTKRSPTTDQWLSYFKASNQWEYGVRRMYTELRSGSGISIKGSIPIALRAH